MLQHRQHWCWFVRTACACWRLVLGWHSANSFGRICRVCVQLAEDAYRVLGKTHCSASTGTFLCTCVGWLNTMPVYKLTL